MEGQTIILGLLPDRLATRFARLARYGMGILVGVLFILPILGAQLGINLNIRDRDQRCNQDYS